MDDCQRVHVAELDIWIRARIEANPDLCQSWLP